MPSASAGQHECALEADSHVRLDSFVAQWLELSRTQSATLIATAGVLVNGAREKASYRPVAGDVVTASIPKRETREVLGEALPIQVAYEDESILIVDKAAGMVVHPAPGNWTGTLVNALIGRTESLEGVGPPERAGIVHRLDKDTSGLLIVAKTDRVHRLLSAALAARRISRVYATMSWGHLEVDRLVIERPIARDPRDRTKMAIVQSGKGAKTTLDRLARFDSVDLLRAHLHTGRTHQIRVHLASIGHPVVGDDTYGGGGGRRVVALPSRRHFLHAAWIRFRHPETGEVIDVRAPLPSDLRASLAQVANDPTLITNPDPLDVYDFYRIPAAS